MTITDLVLVLFIFSLLAYAIYDQFIMPRRNGPTLLTVALLPRSRVDSVIFIGLIVILIYNNITSHGAQFTTWLLCALVLMGLYLFWIRTPKIIFKQKGFFFANVWIEYSRIKAMKADSWTSACDQRHLTRCRRIRRNPPHRVRPHRCSTGEHRESRIPHA